jgi:RNA polymerase sigma-70 factor (ECF subfamily)
LYKPNVLFSSWLYKIAYHYCLNLIRKRNIHQKFKWWFTHELTTESAEETVGKSLFDEPLHSALKQLSVEERNLLVLRVFEEKSFAEIGEILNKSTETVKKRFGRTRIKLQQFMTEEGGRVRWSESDLLSKMKK